MITCPMTCIVDDLGDEAMTTDIEADDISTILNG
jgi:hypothetical protein